VDVIPIAPVRKEPDLIALLDFQTHILQNSINLIVDYCPSIFCGQYQMVKHYADIVAFVNIFAHLAILRRKRRGIQPIEIQSLYSVLALGSKSMAVRITTVDVGEGYGGGSSFAGDWRYWDETEGLGGFHNILELTHYGLG
jgi:hypothetical protein